MKSMHKKIQNSFQKSSYHSHVICDFAWILFPDAIINARHQQWRKVRDELKWANKLGLRVFIAGGFPGGIAPLMAS